MSPLIQRILSPGPGTASPITGLFLWQLDDQSRRLTEDTRGATPEELACQPAPGMNTIGMLLAHIAAVEVGWLRAAVHGLDRDSPQVLGISKREIGLPLPEGAPPAPALAGRDLAYFDGLLARAREFTRASVASLTDADLDRRFRTPASWADDGDEFEGTIGWALYHVLEHEAGHYGQVNLLRHQYGVRTPTKL
ncbi:MAG: DinB family protein [Candidatus Eiseniibacteriota bacterium]